MSETSTNRDIARALFALAQLKIDIENRIDPALPGLQEEFKKKEEGLREAMPPLCVTLSASYSVCSHNRE